MPRSRKRHICFLIDYEKAFDQVKHHKLIEPHHNIKIGEQDIRDIKNLSWNGELDLGVITSTIQHIFSPTI